MIGQIGQIVLRLTIWFLLTANGSLENIIIGGLIAFLLPRSYTSRDTLKQWLQITGKLLRAIPLAYMEAIEMLFHPHGEEDIVMEKVSPRRSPLFVFLDVFLITFTPKTIVVKHHEEGWYEVHRVKRRSGS